MQVVHPSIAMPDLSDSSQLDRFFQHSQSKMAEIRPTNATFVRPSVPVPELDGALFKKKDVVDVQSRMTAGMNRPGGVGRITKVHIVKSNNPGCNSFFLSFSLSPSISTIISCCT